MARFEIHRSWFAVFYPVVLIFITSFLIIPSVRAEEPSQETEAYCLGCHDNPDLSLELPSGDTLSLFISPEILSKSIHSPLGIECQACHTQIISYPHPKLDYQSRRELSRAYYQACQKCHSENYTKTLDSMHAQAASAGNLDAPICTDCHGAHDVQPPDQPRANISATCGQCHTAIFADYTASIHGGALIQEDNPDVPVCTDCHGVHNIQDPRTPQFRVESPELCAGCHANQELMGKYGLSADVYNLYNLSWHGVDISVYKAKWPTIWHESAVCTDCHGVHNILATGNPASMVNPANLLATCQKCHPQAGPNWTGAWTGHNRISLERTPSVFYTDAFYSIFSPVVLWGSIIYVLLQIIHSLVERVRRSLR
ncbi:MAG TPA: cytochrome c3 family protein [Anaerolineales bacterium]|nr:cytochrome c3 family protein [Anaerolineales bacterium]